MSQGVTLLTSNSNSQGIILTLCIFNELLGI